MNYVKPLLVVVFAGLAIAKVTPPASFAQSSQNYHEDALEPTAASEEVNNTNICLNQKIIIECPSDDVLKIDFIKQSSFGDLESDQNSNPSVVTIYLQKPETSMGLPHDETVVSSPPKGMPALRSFSDPDLKTKSSNIVKENKPVLTTDIETSKNSEKLPVETSEISVPSKGDVKFRAVIKYNGFDKPVTTCRARFVNQSKKRQGDLFLLEDELQIADKLPWPKNTALTDKIVIDFANGTPYGSAACKRNALKSRVYSMSELTDIMKSKDPVIELQPRNRVFIAFVNLQSEKVHRSVARWRETFAMVNEVYQTGVASDKWADGVIISVGDDGKVENTFLPKGNFPQEIMTKTNMLDLASDFSTQPRRGFSHSQILSEIQANYNPDDSDDKASILYISDQFPSCRAATKTMADTPQKGDAPAFFVFPVSETSENTGSNKLDGFNKIFSCSTLNTIQPNGHVVAFDLYERAANLDWADAMKQAEKQAEKVEFSREKF